MNKSKIFTILLVTAVLVTKFLWIDRFPPGLAHDEVVYSLNGMSYLQSGSDLTGYAFPLSIFRSETEGFISVVPALIYGFYYKLITPNTQNLRILMTVVNILTAFVLYRLVYILVQNKTIAKLSAFIFLVSPWSYFLSRWGVDTPWALLFTLLSFYFLLKAQNTKDYLLSITFVILTFLSYHGAKLIIVPSMIVIIIYKYTSVANRNRLKLFALCLLTLLILYILVDYILPGSSNGGRNNDLLIFNHSEASGLVDQQRRNSIEGGLSELFSNKPVVTLRVMATKYFSTFSPDILLFSGDSRATYRYGEHGLIYIFEVIFIISGLFYLHKKHTNEFWLIILLVIISPLATALSVVDTSQINRSYLILPLIILLASCGIYHLSQITFFQNKKKLYYSLVILLYVVSYLNFMQFYFFRYPVTSSENTFFSDKLVATYISHITDERNIYVVSVTPKTSLYEYIFFTRNFSNLDFITNNSVEPFVVENVYFMSRCPDYQEGSSYIISRSINCDLDRSHDAEIIDQKDAGMQYKIYNDRLCSDITLDSYKRFHLLEDYDIDRLEKDSFCKKWIYSPKL